MTAATRYGVTSIPPQRKVTFLMYGMINLLKFAACTHRGGPIKTAACKVYSVLILQDGTKLSGTFHFHSLYSVYYIIRKFQGRYQVRRKSPYGFSRTVRRCDILPKRVITSGQ